MIVLGLLLLLGSAGITLAVVLDNTDTVSASALGVSLTDLPVGGLFLIGVAAGAVAMFGLTLLMLGATHKRTKAVATKQRVTRVRSEKEQLAQENEALKAQLAAPERV